MLKFLYCNTPLYKLNQPSYLVSCFRVQTRSGPKIPVADTLQGELFLVFGHWITGTWPRIGTNMILVTLGRFCNLIICFIIANLPYPPDFGPLALPHGLEDGHVVNQLDPGDLGEVRQPHNLLSHRQLA